MHIELISFCRLSADAGVAVLLQAAAASGSSCQAQGVVLRTAARVLRAVRRSEASVHTIHSAQQHLAALEASVPPRSPPSPSVPQLLQASTQALSTAALGVLDSTAVKRAALAVISVVLQLAEGGKLHPACSLPLVTLPGNTATAAEAEWPEHRTEQGADSETRELTLAPSACCMVVLLTPPSPVAVRGWRKGHPEGACTAMLFLEDIAFVSFADGQRAAATAQSLAEEDAAAEADALGFVAKVAEAGCDVLLCQKTISPLVMEAAEDAGILCIPRLGAANMSRLHSVLGCPAVQTWEAVLQASNAQMRSLCSKERIWCGKVGPTGTSVLAIASSVGSIAVHGPTGLQRTQIEAAVEAAFRAVVAKVCAQTSPMLTSTVLEHMPADCAAALSALGISQGWLEAEAAKLADEAFTSGSSALLQSVKVGLHAALVVSDDDILG